MVGEPIEMRSPKIEREDCLMFNGKPLFCHECYGPIDGEPQPVYFWDEDLDGYLGCAQRNAYICQNPQHGKAVI